MMMTHRLRHALALLWLLAFALSACGQYEFKGTRIDPAKVAPDFSLTDADGNVYQLSQQKGKVVTIFFGFTHCPDVCPTDLADMKSVREKLGSDADKLQVVFISVDPERDTPERISKYAKGFDPSFIGLSGERSDLEQIYKDYGVVAIKRELENSALGYTMDHSAYTYVIDTSGNWTALFPFASSVDDRVSDLRYLIRNGA